MKRFKVVLFAVLFLAGLIGIGQTVIPNAGFENWTNFGSYTDPVGWDTPNFELNLIPFIGISVVTKSTDHHGTGTYSAKLETKHYSFPLSPLDVPGFMTCGKLTVDFGTGSYVLSGGVPVVDQPTHLKGFYKYIPKGGDSCVIGIGLTHTDGAVKDTIGMGYFSTKDTINDWTPFSAWIDYISTTAPDSMNIIAMSTAQETMTIGTVLYVDDLYLDYTVSLNPVYPESGISIYNDRETKRLMVFFDFPEPESTRISLYNTQGMEVANLPAGMEKKGRKEIRYSMMPEGIYIVDVLHEGRNFSKKFFLNR